MINMIWIQISVALFMLSGFMDEVKKKLAVILNINDWRTISLKPLDCGTCLTFWTCLVWLISNNQVRISTVLVTLILAYLEPVAENVFLGIKELLIRLTNKIQ